MMKKQLMSLVLMVFVSSAAMGDIGVDWLAPPDGSSFLEGTIVNPCGNANASGQTGGAGLDLALVIDTSGSMGWAPNYTLNNYAKPAAKSLVAALPQSTSSVAVVGFASSGYTSIGLTPLVPNKPSVDSAIDGLSDGGGTNIGAGVSQGTSALLADHTTGRQMMQVVLSDGEGSYSGQATTAYNDHGIVTHTVGVPGHDSTQMSQVASDGNGIYTNVTDLGDLVNLFNGTGGTLVGLDYIDVQRPDGTWLYDYTKDGLGNFCLPDWTMQLGPNVFTVNAYGTDQTFATADLTLYGTVVPVPGALLLGSLGLAVSGLKLRRRKEA